MGRLSEIVAALILVTATVVTVEALHARLGEATLWSLLNPGPEGGRTALPDDHTDVTEAEFQAYLRVLERMQADQTIPIESAAGSESLELDKFRDIEQRVQRNDVLVERARTALRKNAETLWDSRRANLERG